MFNPRHICHPSLSASLSSHTALLLHCWVASPFQAMSHAQLRSEPTKEVVGSPPAAIAQRFVPKA